MPKNHKSWHLDFIIIISTVFAVYGLIQSFLVTHEDTYIVIFAWIAFTVIWAAIAILRYQNLRGKI